MYISKLKKGAIALCCLISILICIQSCQIIIEPDEPELFLNDLSNSLGNFELKNTSSTASKILLEWTIANNATKYDILVNDTICISDIKTTTYLLDRLEPNSSYKVSIRAHDKNNFTKTLSAIVKTTQQSLNEISMLPFGRYEYSEISIIHCKITNDNNYILLSQVMVHGKYQIMVFKTDKNFNVMWRYYLDDVRLSYIDSYQTINQTIDGGFLIVTSQYVFKVSKDGNLIFKNKYYNSTNMHLTNSAVETSNNKLFFVGENYTITNQNFDTLFIKKKDFNIVSDVIQNKAGNIFIFGNTDKYNIGLQEYDLNGNKLREIIYNIPNSYPNLFQKINDEGYFLISNNSVYHYGYGSEMSVTRINNEGEELWTIHSLELLGYTVTAYGATFSKENSLLCLCYNSPSQNYYINEISLDGKITKTFRAGDMYVPRFVDKDENGKYIILTREGYIYKLSSER